MKTLEDLFKEWDQPMKLQYGTVDCIAFAARAFTLQTGKEVLHLFTEQYSTLEEGEQWLKDHDYNSIEDAVTDVSGITPVNALDAQYGDIVSARSEAKEGAEIGIGVCKGARAYFVRSDGKKLIRVPLSMCRLSWSTK